MKNIESNDKENNKKTRRANFVTVCACVGGLLGPAFGYANSGRHAFRYYCEYEPVSCVVYTILGVIVGIFAGLYILSYIDRNVNK